MPSSLRNDALYAYAHHIRAIHNAISGFIEIFPSSTKAHMSSITAPS